MKSVQMIHLALKTSYLILFVLASDAVKFQDETIHPSVADEIQSSLDFIEDFDDVDGRIMTGHMNVRKKKHYAISEDEVNKGNKNNGISNETKHGYRSDGKREGVQHKPMNDRPDIMHDSERFGIANTDSEFNGEMEENTNGNNDVFQESVDNVNNVETETSSSVLHECVRDSTLGVLPCISQKAVSFLERYSHSSEDINVEDNLVLSPNPEAVHQSRLIPPGEDPTDFRTGLEALSTFLQRRTMRYHMRVVYPGLYMVVNPSYNGKGVIEFQLDPRSNSDERQLSTGRLLIKRNVLPFLLRFKISIISLLPIVFAIMFILTKKAMILSKLALLITSFIGFSSISKLLSHAIKGAHYQHGHFDHPHGYGAYTGGGGYYQGHPFEESIPSGGTLFGFVDELLGYKKPPSGGFGGAGGNGADYHPEPELIFHTPNFKKDGDRSSKRVGWKRI